MIGQRRKGNIFEQVVKKKKISRATWKITKRTQKGKQNFHESLKCSVECKDLHLDIELFLNNAFILQKKSRKHSCGHDLKFSICHSLRSPLLNCARSSAIPSFLL